MGFSQNSEEEFILDYFDGKATGKFIDIGAYDVEKFSNTRALYMKGWKGIFVEPAPKNFEAIAKHYENDPEVSVLNVAVGDTTGEIDFFACEDAVSTSNETHMDKWKAAGVPFQRIRVAQISANHFMKQYCQDVDFLSIDTEATNMNVFRDIPDFVWQQIKMLCIEHDNCYDEVENKLLKFGFTRIYFNAENIILAKL